MWGVMENLQGFDVMKKRGRQGDYSGFQDTKQRIAKCFELILSGFWIVKTESINYILGTTEENLV